MLNKNIQNGVLNQSSEYNLPIIDCQSATPETPVIILKNDNFTAVYENNNCIYIEANNFEYVKIRDKLSYYLFGFLN